MNKPHSHSPSDAMNFEQRLNLVADRFRSLGYKVVLRPTPDELPPFAKDFKLELLATRDDGSVLVSAKADAIEVETDPNLPRYALVNDQQPGWRFDLYVLAPETQPIPENREAKEPSEEDIGRSLAEVERMFQAGFVAQAVSAAWAVLESAMRQRLRAAGEQAGWGTTPRTMLNELFSSGLISTADLRHLEKLLQLRTAIVHGFALESVDPNAVRRLVETARRMLTESQMVKQTA